MRYALQKNERTEFKPLFAFSLQVLESRVSCLQKNRLRALLTSIPAGVSLRSTLKTIQASLTDFFTSSSLKWSVLLYIYQGTK